MELLNKVLDEAIEPAFKLLPPKLTSDRARVQLLATGLQESRLKFRYQKTPRPYEKGPARSLWQIERPTVQLIMTNVTTDRLASDLCIARNVPFDAALVHAKLEFDDILAAGFARLLLWAEPRPLPPVDCDHETAWKYYIRTWRPGEPHRHTWDEFHASAQAAILWRSS